MQRATYRALFAFEGAARSALLSSNGSNAHKETPFVKPEKSILDRTFNYTNAADTDLRKTFARIRREMKKANQERNLNTSDNVTTLPKERKEHEPIQLCTKPSAG